MFASLAKVTEPAVTLIWPLVALARFGNCKLPRSSMLMKTPAVVVKAPACREPPLLTAIVDDQKSLFGPSPPSLSTKLVSVDREIALPMPSAAMSMLRGARRRWLGQ